ncbi:LuxR C-terminal-related transcriptional regulator [Mycolicibacterium thermoresistibile]
MRLSWPLTGHSKELRLIQTAVSDPACDGVVIFGDAGVGKSRIARAALSRLAASGCQIRWVAATASARRLPLGALAAWAEPDAHHSLEVVGRVVAEMAAPAGSTTVVGVDDAPLLDDLSTFVVLQLIQQRLAKVVLTVRDGVPIADGVRELWKSGQFERLDLQPLSKAEMAALVSSAVGGPVDPHAVHRIWQLTQGNPLYLRNIVEQEVAAARLVAPHGYWRWYGDPVVPPGLIALIEERIGLLAEPVGDVVDILAVGEPVDLGLLTRLTDPAAVEEADVHGLIAIEDGDRALVRLAHPLYGEVRRRRAAVTRLRRLRGLVADELAQTADADDLAQVVRRTTLLLDSDRRPDVDLFVRAARGAARIGDLPLAERLSGAAVRAGATVEAAIVHARALTWLGRGDQAETVLAAIDVADHTRLAFMRASNMLWALSDPEGAKRLIGQAAAGMPADQRAHLDAFCAVHAAAMGQPDEVFRHAEVVVVDELPGIIGAETAWALTLAAGEAGRTAEAVAAADTGYRLTARFSDAAYTRFTLTDAHVTALILAGRIAAAVDTAGGFYGFGYRYQHPYATALAVLGHTAAAATALATLDEREFPSWRYLDHERTIALAWLRAAQGAVSTSIQRLRAEAESARTAGRFAVELLCLQTAVQFGDRTCGPRLHQLEDRVDGPRVAVAARFADALHTGDGSGLRSIADEFEDMGDMVAAADAAAHAAIAHRRRGLRGSALACSAHAQGLAERCGGAHTPALRRAAEDLPLTDREREIVLLLGAGLTNREIADTLTLSVRTVENHIYKSMLKTGTSSRDELAALLPRSPRPSDPRRAPRSPRRID